MTKLQSPWISIFLFAAASATGSAQEASDGPVSRLVGRFRQPAEHHHHHVHAAPVAPAAGYVYVQAEAPAAAVVETTAVETPVVAHVEAPAVPQAEVASQAAEEVAPEAEGTPAEANPEVQTYQDYAAGCDPYGFTNVLNSIRASAGLHPLAYDPDLSAWASQNNAEQCRLGLGHHVNPSCFQNCAYNYGDANSAAAGWMDSPGHRRNMLSPSATRFGIAFGPGPYWTLNAR